MKPFDFRKLLLWSALALAAVGGWLRAEEPPATAPEPAAAPAPATPPDKSSDVQATDEHPAKDVAEVSEPAKTDEAAPASSEPEEKPARPAKRSRRSGSRDDDRVSVGDNNHIPAGTTVPQSAVAVMGDLTVDGEVLQDAVAVMGNNTINGHVHHSAVAIMGDLVLGPKAVVDGDLVCVGGEIKRDPGATVGGQITRSFGPNLRSDSFGNWWDHGLKIGRPLAIGAHLGWLWIITGFSIAFYALLGLVFPARITACGEKLVQEPAQVLLAAILAVLALPVLFVLLCITIIGIPIALLVLPVSCLFMAMFGKAALYALVGRKLTNDRFHPAIAVIIGALLAVVLYLVPVLGLLLSLVIWFLGFGCAVLLMFGKPKPAPGAPVVPPPAFVAPAPTASPTENFVPPVIPAPAASGFAEPPPMAAAAPASGASVVAAMVVTADTMPRAGFWIRVAAALLDFLMLVVPIGITGAFNHGPGLFFLILAGYHASMWKLKGTTIGGVICGLKVVRLDDRPLDWGVTIVRALSAFLSLFVAGLGFIWVAFDDEKQSWHDKVAGTTIVRVPKGTSLL